MGLEARLRLARLYLCTDARQKQGDLESFLQAVFAGGVDIVQIREKDMKPEAELAALEIARQAAGPYQGIVCVNDSPELAGRFQADMLHLGQADGSAARARRARPTRRSKTPTSTISAWDLFTPLLPTRTTSRLAWTWSAMQPGKLESEGSPRSRGSPLVGSRWTTSTK